MTVPCLLAFLAALVFATWWYRIALRIHRAPNIIDVYRATMHDHRFPYPQRLGGFLVAALFRGGRNAALVAATGMTAAALNGVVVVCGGNPVWEWVARVLRTLESATAGENTRKPL